MPRSIETAPRDGALIWLHCRSETEPVIGYWSKTFIGWVAYHEALVAELRAIGWIPERHHVLT